MESKGTESKGKNSDQTFGVLELVMRGSFQKVQILSLEGILYPLEVPKFWLSQKLNHLEDRGGNRQHKSLGCQ